MKNRKRKDEEEDSVKINLLQKDGHTYHCACRQVWGDGECECQKKGIIPGSISRKIEELRKDK